MTERILITGASGNIGREIVKRLKDRQVDFVAASRQEAFFEPTVRQLSVDYASQALMKEACRDVDVLFLILPLDEGMREYARNAIEGAREAGVKFILLSSILGADPESNYLLHRTHGEIEDMLRGSRIPWAIMRPNTFMQRFVNRYGPSIQQGALFLPEGEAKSSLIDTRDLAEVAVQILVDPWEFEERQLDLTGVQALSVDESLAEIAKVLGRRIAYIPVTEAASRYRMLRDGCTPWMVEALLSHHRAAREGVTSQVTKHNEVIRNQAPRLFADFCREAAEYWVAPNFESPSEMRSM